jgi:hypothetical protein
MAVSAGIYGQGMLKIATGNVDLDTDAFKAMLTTVTYNPVAGQDTHTFRSDVTNEITGTGYTAGGVALGGITATYDAATNEVRWDWNDPSWAAATFTARIMVVYKSRGGAATADELVMWVDFGADETVTSGTFTYVVPATGALAITVT